MQEKEAKAKNVAAAEAVPKQASKAVKSAREANAQPKAKPAQEAAKPVAKKEALKPVEGYDPWVVLSYPHLTEKSMNLVEKGNVLVFIVSMKADKAKIKEAVEKGFGAKVEGVRVEITKKNQKKAYVKLAEGTLASDIATRLGMI